MRHSYSKWSAALLLTLPLAAAAQTPPNSTAAKPPLVSDHVDEVLVQGQRVQVDDTARNFIMHFTKPAPAGTFALWRDQICPTTLGMTADFNYFVTRRIRTLAAEVGAPLDRRDPCRTNIEIIFTTQPQATLDALSKVNPLILGYDNNYKVKYPIQAWYGTMTRTENGNPIMDDPFEDPPWVPAHLSRLYTGVTAEFGTILILVDAKAVQGQSLGAVADYIALLSLSQARAFDECQDVPTIANLMAADCAIKPISLTDIDTGYLTGLYKSDTGGPEVLQRQRMISGMKKDMAGQ